MNSKERLQLLVYQEMFKVKNNITNALLDEIDVEKDKLEQDIEVELSETADRIVDRFSQRVGEKILEDT